MRYFVDKRTHTLASEDDLNIKYLAPELFHEFCCSNDDTAREVWWVDEEKTIDFAYSREDMGSMILEIMRSSYFKNQCVNPLYLKAYFVPKDLFKKVVIGSGYKID